MNLIQQEIKQKTKAQWQPAYINYELIKTLIQPFLIMSILYKYIIHHNDESQQSIDQLPEQQLHLLRLIGQDLQKILLFQRRKSDVFIRYKIYQLYSEWLSIEESMTNLQKISYRQFRYQSLRKNIKQSVEIIYRNTNSVIQFININNKIATQLKLQATKEINNFYKWSDQKYTFFAERNPLEPFASFINEFYSQQFCPHFSRNKLDLLTIKQMKQTKPNQIFLMGLFIGFAIFLVLIMSICFFLDLIQPDFKSNDSQSFKYVFPMFRGVAIFILYLWGLSWNVWGFTYFSINYRLILKMGNHYSTYGQVMKRAGFFTVLLLCMVILYLIGKQYNNRKNENIPVQYTPFVVYLIYFSYIFFPSQSIFNPKGRKYFYTILQNIVFSPFIKMQFIIAFTTDQLVSFVGPLKDLAYTMCYYTSNFTIPQIQGCLAYNTIKGVLIGYIVALIPLIFRMIQCFNQAWQTERRFFGHLQMWNFLKYTTSVCTATFSFLNRFNPQLLIAYIISSIISTLFAYYWDLKYDWGLLQEGARYRFLRNTLSYKNPIIYYWVIVLNLILRCSWTLTISSFVIAQLDSTLLIFRRCLWNFFRIQKQHLANCQNFRTAQKISLVLNQQEEQEPFRKSSSQCDYYTKLQFMNTKYLNRKSANKVHEANGQVFQLIQNTSLDMVTNSLQSFKQMALWQQSFLKSLNFQQNTKKLYQMLGRRKVALAQYKLKQS